LRVKPGSCLNYKLDWPLIWVNIKIKSVIIIILKPYSRVELGSCLGHELGWPLTRVNIKIKIVIIMILKFKSEVDPGSNSSPGLGPLT